MSWSNSASPHERKSQPGSSSASKPLAPDQVGKLARELLISSTNWSTVSLIVWVRVSVTSIQKPALTVASPCSSRMLPPTTTLISSCLGVDDAARGVERGAGRY